MRCWVWCTWWERTQKSWSDTRRVNDSSASRPKRRSPFCPSESPPLRVLSSSKNGSSVWNRWWFRCHIYLWIFSLSLLLSFYTIIFCSFSLFSYPKFFPKTFVIAFVYQNKVWPQHDLKLSFVLFLQNLLWSLTDLLHTFVIGFVLQKLIDLRVSSSKTFCFVSIRETKGRGSSWKSYQKRWRHWSKDWAAG